MYKIQNIKEGIYDLVYITFLHGSPSYKEDVIRNGIDLLDHWKKCVDIVVQ